MRIRHLLLVSAVLGSAAISACSSAAPASSRSRTASPATQSACAWPIEDNYLTSNSGLPDSGAWYWAQPFTIHEGTQIVVSGVYPDARYASPCFWF
jgi:hypothetical protein